MPISTRSRRPSDSYSWVSRSPNNASPSSRAGLRPVAKRFNRLDGRQCITRLLHVVDADDLGPAAQHCVARHGERVGQPPAHVAIRQLAEKSLARYADTHRSAKTL